MKTRRFQESYVEGLKRQINFIAAKDRPRCAACSLRGDSPEICKRHMLRVSRDSVCNDFKRAEVTQ